MNPIESKFAVNPMSFRASAQAIILFELIVGSAFLLFGYATSSDIEIVWLVPSIAFIHLLIFSAPLALLKGFSYVIYDADPNSPWKYYGFLAIFIATMIGSLIDNAIYEFVITT
jgi:hypothetical protein